MVSGINYRTETDKGDKSGLLVKKAGSQVERGINSQENRYEPLFQAFRRDDPFRLLNHIDFVI